MSGFEVGKSYRVLPEFYDIFEFVGWWDGKSKDEVFIVEYVDCDDCVIFGDYVIAFNDEFKYCQEVSGDSNDNKTTLDYSKCLYASPEYIGYYVSFKYYDQIKYCYIDNPEIKHDGKWLKFTCPTDGEKWWVYLEDLTFYQEDGSECSFEDLT